MPALSFVANKRSPPPAVCPWNQLQSPESFAKSVQELTIVLQRTGDPANLASLRPHLELLAAIDHNPGGCLHIPHNRLRRHLHRG